MTISWSGIVCSYSGRGNWRGTAMREPGASSSSRRQPPIVSKGWFAVASMRRPRRVVTR